MPKLSVYLPDGLAAAVREAQVPVSAICQTALERAVREVAAARGAGETPPPDVGSAAVGLFGRFTDRARQVVGLAQEAARAIPHNYIGTEHVLLGLLDQGENVAITALLDLEIEPSELRDELRASMGQASTGAPAGHIPFTPLAKRALELTAKEALTLGHNYIGCEHLLLGLLATEEGLASRVMRRMGVETRTTRMAIVGVLVRLPAPASRPPAATTATASSAATLEQILARLDAIERRLDP